MEYALVCAVAVAASALTFVSGFGLGTLLLPAFALFFPIPLAVAATAVVHLANNLFKLALVRRWVHLPVLLRFGVPAALGALAGAALLELIARQPPLFTYAVGGRPYAVMPVKLAIASLMVVFALFELDPGLARLSFARRWLGLGGLLSGFFGGLSGHQGALRSAFLLQTGLDKQAFVATGAAAAVVIDAARLVAYGWSVHAARFGVLDARLGRLVAAATLAAFAGSLAGMKLLERMTLRGVQLAVGALLLVVAAGLGTGLL